MATATAAPKVQEPQVNLLSLLVPSRPAPSLVEREANPSEAENSAPDYLGHRKRLKERYAESGLKGLRDYELVELLLSYSIPHRDTKPYAKRLLAVFKNLRSVLEADLKSLEKLGGLPTQSALHFKAMGDLFRLSSGNNSSAAGPFPAPATPRIFSANRSAIVPVKYLRFCSSITATI